MHIPKSGVPEPLLWLLLVELAVFGSAPLLANNLFVHEPLSAAAAFTALGLFLLTMTLSCASMGLYDRRQRFRFFGILFREIIAIGVSFIAMFCLTCFLEIFSVPCSVLVIGASIVSVLIAITRTIFYCVVDMSIFKRRVLVCGAGHRAVSMSNLRRRSDTSGIQIVGFYQISGETILVPSNRVVTLSGSLLDYCQQNLIDELVVAMDDRRRLFPVYELLQCRLNGYNVVDIADLLERETRRVKLDVLSPSWFIFSPGFRRGRLRAFSKRFFDLVASALLLMLAAPFLVLSILAIKLEDGFRTTILYKQRRVGRGGKVFSIVKLRSMKSDAETDGGPQWARAKDARITRVGAILRKTRIDEIPQIFNILRGDMSFVGPRPERPEFVAGLEDRIPYYRERHSIKPGITGWAQLCYPYGSSESDAAHKLEYDLYYLKHQSFLFDCMVLVRTVEVILWGRGSR